MAGELEHLERQVEVTARSIHERVARIYDALHSLHDLTLILHAAVEPGVESGRARVQAWLEREGFGLDAHGYFERLAVLERARAGECDPLLQTYYANAELAANELAVGRMYAMRDMPRIIAGIKERLSGLAWIYYQDATGFAMTYPMHDPCTVVPPDFDWHAYYTYVSVHPDANPEGRIRWTPPNIDYGGKGLMVSASIPLYASERGRGHRRVEDLVGVWSFDVAVTDLIERVGSAPLLRARAEASAEQGHATFIVERSGQLIAHDHLQTLVTKEGEVFRESLRRLGGDFEDLDLEELLAAGAGRRELVDGSGTSLQLVYHAIPSLQWLFMCTVPTRGVLAVVERSFAEAFERAKAGDLSHRIADVGGELQALVEGFNDMSAAVGEVLAGKERALNQLEDSRRHARALFETAPVGLAVVSPEGVLRDVNPRLVQTLSATDSAGLLGRRIQDFAAPEVAGDLEALLAEAVASGQAGPLERTLARADASAVPVRLLAHRLVRDGATFALTCVEDITEQRRLQTELLQTHKMQAVGRLASGIAHDFNNLLTVILGGASFLGMGAIDEDQRELVAGIEDAAQHAAALTGQLLAYTRREVVQRRRVEVAGAIEQCQRLFARLLDHGIELHVDVAPELPAIRFDESQLIQIVMNLVLNARDALPSGGRIELRAVAGSGPSGEPELHLSVRDDGEGMDADTYARIFEPFFTTKRTGTGLGLATIKDIVAAAGGRLSVESALGQGSVFTCCIPALGEAGEARASGGAAKRRRSLEGAVLLVVDDDPMVREMAVRILRRAGATVHFAANGREGIELLRGRQGPARGGVELVVCDLAMPGMSGREFAEHVGAWPQPPAILFMSGYTDDAIVRQGVTTLLRKPFTPGALVQAVQGELASR